MATSPLVFPSAVFTCTFCHHLSADQPRLLGRSARLTCSTCFSAIIDLSICWVCGEIIFRDEECVSFGWLFWHRGCYGCLLYGSRAVCQGPTVGELFKRGDIGKEEVQTPPLCAYCVVEAEVDGVDEKGVLEKGMERVERYDGGLTRYRQEEKKRISEWPGYSTKAGLDGNADLERHSRPQLDCSAPADSTIWVDIFDPINGPSFRPAPLKPIPWFMTRPPKPEMEALRRPSAVDRYLHSPSPLNLSSPSVPSTVCPSRSSSPVVPPNENRPVTPLYVSDSADSTASPPQVEPKRQRTFSTIREEPLIRPSSRRAAKARESRSESDEYLTAKEWPQLSMDAMLCDGLALTKPHGHPPRDHEVILGAVSPEQSTEYLQRYTRAELLLRHNGEDARQSRGRKRGVGAELRRLFMGR